MLKVDSSNHEPICLESPVRIFCDSAKKAREAYYLTSREKNPIVWYCLPVQYQPYESIYDEMEQWEAAGIEAWLNNI
jgi:hypothetical protein